MCVCVDSLLFRTLILINVLEENMNKKYKWISYGSAALTMLETEKKYCDRVKDKNCDTFKENNNQTRN